MANKVSILIPVYNREKIISETVESALSQTYSNFELVIVDNASTDRTWNILQGYAQRDSRIKIIRNGTNIGPVRNWKRCIKEATGVYGKILWSDDLIASEFLEKATPFLDDNDDVGFVFTGTEIFVDGTDAHKDVFFIGRSGLRSTNDFISNTVKGGKYPASPSCALFRLNDLEKYLLINVPNKVGSEFSMHAIGNDLLLFLLVAYNYKYFAFINQRLSFFRVHAGSISIQSNDGKLPLHYDLAIAYFLENYRPDQIMAFNAKLFLDLKRYPNSEKYGLNRIKDFYMSNKTYQISWLRLVEHIVAFSVKVALKSAKKYF